MSCLGFIYAIILLSMEFLCFIGFKLFLCLVLLACCVLQCFTVYLFYTKLSRWAWDPNY